MSADDLFVRLQLAMKKIETSITSPVIDSSEVVSQLNQQLELTEAKNRALNDKISYTDLKLESLQLKLEQMIEGLT